MLQIFVRLWFFGVIAENTWAASGGPVAVGPLLKAWMEVILAFLFSDWLTIVDGLPLTYTKDS